MATANAQWTSNNMINTPVRAGSGVDAATPLMASVYDGSTYVSWFDAQPGGYQLRMQRLDAQGYSQWATEGLLISDHPQNSALFRYDLQVDNDGNAIVAFQDERTGQLDIVVYKVGPDGALLWGTDGIALTALGSVQGLAPVIGVLTSNDVVIAWSANDGGSDRWIPLQKISADGFVQWASPQLVGGDVNCSRPQLLRTLTGGFLLQYVEETGNFPFTSDLYAQRYTSDGTAVWPEATHVSTKTIPFFHFPQPTTDGADGFYLAFNTGNPENQSLSDVYLQRVYDDGHVWDPEGTRLITGTTTQRFNGQARLLNEFMGTMVAVEFTDISQSTGGLLVQRVDPTGVVQMGAGGIELVPLSDALPRLAGSAHDSSSLWIAYTDGGSGSQRVKAYRCYAAGWPLWSPAVMELCAVNSTKTDPACGQVRNDQFVAVWQDDRANGGLFAQNITSEGLLGIATGLPVQANASAAAVYVLDADMNGVDLSLRGFSPGPSVIRLIDAQGRLISQQTVAIAGGDHRVGLRGCPVGAYVVEVIGSTGLVRVPFISH